MDVNQIKYVTVLVFLSGGVSLLTLSVNGTTAGPALRLLGLSKPKGSRDGALQLLKISVEDFLAREYKRLLRESRFHDTMRFSIVQCHVPLLKEEKAHPKTPSSSLGSSNIASADTVFDEFRMSMISSIHDSGTDDRQRIHERIVNSASSVRDTQDAVVEMRRVFLELLAQAYETILERGELDIPEIDQGFNADVLKQTLAFAAEAVDHNESINDWEYTKIFRQYGTAQTFLQNRFMPRSSGKLYDDMSPKDYRELRINALRAVCFIEAHNIAECKLEYYIQSIDHALVGSVVAGSKTQGDETVAVAEMLATALETVINESKGQVVEAKKVLQQIPDHDMEIIMSHYVAIILLNRLSHFIVKDAVDGALSTREAQTYLEKIDRAVHETVTCGRTCCQEGHDDSKPDEERLSPLGISGRNRRGGGPGSSWMGFSRKQQGSCPHVRDENALSPVQEQQEGDVDEEQDSSGRDKEEAKEQ